MKNKRWREFVHDKLSWSDPCDGRLTEQQFAYKTGYEQGLKDAQPEDSPDKNG